MCCITIFDICPLLSFRQRGALPASGKNCTPSSMERRTVGPVLAPRGVPRPRRRTPEERPKALPLIRPVSGQWLAGLTQGLLELGPDEPRGREEGVQSAQETDCSSFAAAHSADSRGILCEPPHEV